MLSCTSGSVPSEINVHSFKIRRAHRPRFAMLDDGGSWRQGDTSPRREINAHSRCAGTRAHPFNIALGGRGGFAPPCLVEGSSGRYFRSGRERNPLRVVKRGNSNRKMRPSAGGRPALASRAERAHAYARASTDLAHAERWWEDVRRASRVQRLHRSTTQRSFQRGRRGAPAELLGFL